MDEFLVLLKLTVAVVVSSLLFGIPSAVSTGHWGGEGYIQQADHQASDPEGRAPAVVSAGAISLNEVTTVHPAWANVTAPSSPAPRVGAELVYDPVDGYDVMFGGEGLFGPTGDTWAFVGNAWQELDPTTHPEQRDHYSMVWDPAGPYVLLFGGAAPNATYWDSWAFEHGEWTRLSTPVHPQARWGAAMTWDTSTQSAVLFGGCANFTALNDTWEFENGAWRQTSTPTAPSPREDPAMEFDPAANATFLFGGDDYDGLVFSDTWSLSDGKWTLVQTESDPGPLTYSSFQYDPAIRALVLFGGFSTQPTGMTWWLANGSWGDVPASTHPSPRELAAMGPIPNGTGLLLFSGEGATGLLPDTWAYYNLSANLLVGVSPTDPSTLSFADQVVGAEGHLHYNWVLGDGTVSSQPTLQHRFGSPGLYLVECDVNDSLASGVSQVLVTQVGSSGTAGAGSESMVTTAFLFSAVLVSSLTSALAVAAASIVLMRRRGGRSRRTGPNP